MPEPSAARWTIQEAVAPGISAVKANWAPFLAIQAASVAIVLIYYRFTPLQDALASLSEWKVAGGLAFAAIGGAVAGGLIPEVAKLATGRLRNLGRKWQADTAFNAFVYAVVGVEVDLFYQAQARWFGNGVDFSTLATKVLVDMSFFATVVSIPTAVLLFDWRKLGARELRTRLTSTYYRDKIVPSLVPCWAFWFPVCFSVYAMPVNLQYCLSILAEAAWSILFVFIATQSEAPA